MGENKSKDKVWKRIKIVLCMLEAIAFVALGLRVVKMVPARYMFVFAVFAIFLLSCSAYWIARAERKSKKGLPTIILTVMMIVVCFWGSSVLGQVDDVLQDVTAESEKVTTEMVLLVLKESKIEQVEQISDFSVGYMDPYDEMTQHIQSELKNALVQDLNYVVYNDMFMMVDSLYAKKSHAIILDKAYIDVISEMEGYETFANDVRELFTAEIVNYIQLPEVEEDTNSFIVYVSGIDRFGAISATSRSDVNLLLVVNTETKQIQMINTPRDYYVPLANSHGVKDKLTHAGIYGVNNSIGTLEMLYDIDIDYYVRVNFSGFEAIIDALGGIDVYSEYDFTVEPVKHYKKGMNHVTGLQALAFARERYAFPAGDIQRGKNQMEVVRATIQKALSPEILRSYSEILESVSGTFQTNIPSDIIYSLVKMQLSDMATWEMNTYSVTGSGKMSTTYSMPNRTSYVMLPNTAQVEEAKTLIGNVLEGE